MTSVLLNQSEKLKDCMLSQEQSEETKRAARDFPSWDLTPRQMNDIELLIHGAFSPLSGFMTEPDYQRVLDEMRLSDGSLWPIPVTLDVSEDFASKLTIGNSIALRDPEGVLIAVMRIESLWRPDRIREAQAVYGTQDPRHPGVNYLLNRSHPVYVGGAVLGIELPHHYDFKDLRNTPRELRDKFKKLGWQRSVAFHTHNPIHRAHYELMLRAVKVAEANLLIHPVIGFRMSNDPHYYSRVQGYKQVLRRFPEQTTTLSLIPLATRMAGPKEALWHAIIRRNYGCTHFIVGRGHACPGDDGRGSPFYSPYEAHDLILKYQGELDIRPVLFPEMVYVQDRAEHLPIDHVEKGDTVLHISGTDLRRRLQEDIEIPEWFSYPEVVEELKKACPPRHRQGFSVFLTGLSGAGKSTISKALLVKLEEMGGRSVTLLDGDVVRKHLSSELGFSREHRDLNILRIGYVASEITKHGGIAICAPIAPYQETRQKVRQMIGEAGGFVEVYVSTPIDVCETRDRKGLYAKARAGIIKQFTGISDPYETPLSPELIIDTQDCSPDEAAQRIILKLEKLGFVR